MSARKNIPHIKRHTAGTSNELSFDVLDAARNELDGQKSSSSFRGRKLKKGEGESMSFLFSGIEGVPSKKGGKQKPIDPGAAVITNKPSLPSLPSLPSRAQAEPQDEVTRRKKARQAHNVRVRVLVALVVVFLLGVAGTYVYHVVQEQRAFDAKFLELTERFTTIDAEIVKADTLMGSLFEENADEVRQQTLSSLPRIKSNLAVVKTQASKLAEEAKSSRDKMVMGQVEVAIEARQDMVAAAEKTIELANTIEQNVAVANAAWDEAISADQKARDAAELANVASTDENTQAAMDATDEARADFEEVLYSLQYLENTLETLDLSAHKAFVEKKIEALGYASATSWALINNDRDAARENNDAYNAADIEAASLAEGLPLSLEPTIREHFDEELQRLTAQYDEARSRAIGADAVIRDYLG